MADNASVCKRKGYSSGTPPSSESIEPSPPLMESPSLDVFIYQKNIDSMLDDIKDLLIATHYQQDKIKDVTKKKRN